MNGGRYMRQIGTGHVYAWAPELEDRPDMEPFEFPEPEPEKPAKGGMLSRLFGKK